MFELDTNLTYILGDNEQFLVNNSPITSVISYLLSRDIGRQVTPEVKVSTAR